MKSSLKSLLKFIFFLALGLLITWLSIKNLTEADKVDIINSFKNVNFFWIVIVMVVGIISHLARALRWQMLLEPVTDKPLLKNTFIAVIIGYFANLAFPRLGEVTRCGVLMTTDQVPVNRSLGTVVTERGLDFIIFFLLFIILIATQYELLISYINEKVFLRIEDKLSFAGRDHLIILMLLTVIITTIVFIITIVKAKPQTPIRYKIKLFVKGFWEGIISISRVKSPFLFIIYTITIWLCYFFMTWLCFFTLDATFGLSMNAAFAVLILGSIGVMITPGGIGLYPVIARDTLGLYGIVSTTGFAMGWILWTSQTALIILAGIAASIWLSTLKKRKKIKEVHL